MLTLKRNLHHKFSSEVHILKLHHAKFIQYRRFGLVKLVSTASLCSVCHTKPLLLPNSLNTASNWLPGEWRAAHADEFRDKTRHTYHISIELMPKKPKKSKAY